MARRVGAQGQIISVTKLRGHTHIMTSSTERTKPHNEKYVFLKVN